MKAAQGASRTLFSISAKFYNMESIRRMKTNQTDTEKVICSCVCPPTAPQLPPFIPRSHPSTAVYPVFCLISSHLSVSCLVFPLYLCFPSYFFPVPPSITHKPPCFTSLSIIYFHLPIVYPVYPTSISRLTPAPQTTICLPCEPHLYATFNPFSAIYP